MFIKGSDPGHHCSSWSHKTQLCTQRSIEAKSRPNQDQLSANQRRRFKGQFSQIEGIIFRGLCSLKTKYS